MTDGTPAYVALTEFDSFAAVLTVTGRVVGPSVLFSNPGATAWISVPVTLTISENGSSCESIEAGLPKLTQSSVAKLKPLPVIVTTEPPVSLASEAGPPAFVEIDVIVGFGS